MFAAFNGLIEKVLRAWLEWLAELPRPAKQAMVFTVDVVLLIQSIWIAMSLRLGEWILWSPGIQKFAIGALVLMVPIYFFMGVYSTIFRFVGFGMLATLWRAAVLYSIFVFAIFTLVGIEDVPRTVGIIQPIIMFGLVGAARVIVRFLFVDVLGRSAPDAPNRRLLIYGAGAAGRQIVSSLRSEAGMQVVGYVEDDARLDGHKLDGIKVYHSKSLHRIVGELAVSDLLLAMPTARRTRRRELLKELSDLKVRVQTLPLTTDIVDGNVTVNDIRPLQIEDLLGRESVKPNQLLLSRTTVGKALLVTGAGGSIGAELCRQIVDLRARKLVLFEISEFSLYSIHRELLARAKAIGLHDIEIVPVLGSVSDPARLAEVFRRHAIDTVYHAAAYKHVPLVEANPVQAVRNNIIGTYEVVQAARTAKVRDFILISTDKAVRPTNVMGATKRAAEQVVQAFAAKTAQTRFSMVRFGNVLGSSGSVVPLFRQQIEAGGPITLTDKKVTRYFMTIPEAASLVIQAAGMARGGEVFVLDMGKPVKIYDLARTMIQLSGLSVRDEKHPDGEIEIVEVGLRDGEKLYEELLIGDNPEPTKHARIRMARESHLSWAKLRTLLQAIEETTESGEAIALLHELVPEFEHRRDNDAPAKAATPAA